MTCGFDRFFGVLLLGVLLCQQAGAQGVGGYYLDCGLYDEPGHPHTGGGNGTVWFHGIVVDGTTGQSATGVLDTGSGRYVYSHPDVHNHHYGKHQQKCHLAWDNLPAGYDFFVTAGRVYIAPAAAHTGQSVMFQGRLHSIYDSGVPEIGYIVKYKYEAVGSGSAFAEWRALNASQGQEVLAVTRAGSVQAIWESRAFGIISPRAEIEVYLVSRGTPTTILPIAAGAQQRYLLGITRGRVEFDGYLKAQPTTIPEPSLDYTVNAYSATGGFEGVHQYQFGFQGGIQPPQPPGCPGSPGCPPPPIVATCRTPNVPPQVFLPTVRLSDFNSSSFVGGTDFVLSFKDCENTTGFSYYFQAVEYARPGASTSWGSYLSVAGTARGVMLELLEETGGVYTPLDFGNSVSSPGIATSVRHINGPYNDHSIKMRVGYFLMGGYWYWDNSQNRWYWIIGVREGSVEGALRTYVEYQ